MTDIYTAEDKTMPAVCYALYLIAFATGITAVIGLVIAYAQRQTAGPVNGSHYTFLIRTFWIGLAVFLGLGVLIGISAVLSVVLIGIPFLMLFLFLWGAVGVWFAIRCAVGLIYLSQGEAYPRPQTWLI